MNPLRWIARNQTIAQVLGIGFFCLLAFGATSIREIIGQDSWFFRWHVDVIYLLTWVIIFWYARYKYAPETLPQDGVPISWRVGYSIGAVMVILLTYYLIQHFHWFA
jgi:hypothetical protein